MTNPDFDKKLNDLIYKAIVPKGLRPTNDDEIDAMLDTIGGDTPSEESIQQMLRKIRGEEPIGIRHTDADRMDDIIDVPEDMDISEEALALYRNQNKNIPPEIEQKMKDMEKRAMEEDAEQEEDQGDANT